MPAQQPTLAGFLVFVRTVMGVTTAQLPDSDPVIGMSLAIALAIVNPALKKMPIPSQDAAGATLNAGGWSIYALAVYNLGGSNLINFAQDPPDAPPIRGTDPPMPFFQALRRKYNTEGFVSGIIQSSNDESTGQSLVVQDAAKAFTLENLQQLKDPFGRRYLALAQSYGPTTWGLS